MSRTASSGAADFVHGIEWLEDWLSASTTSSLLHSISRRAHHATGALRACVLLASGSDVERALALESGVGGLTPQDIATAVPLLQDALKAGGEVERSCPPVALCVPWPTRDGIAGALYVDTPAHGKFNDAQRSTLLWLSTLAGLALRLHRKFEARPTPTAERAAALDAELAELRRLARRHGEPTLAGLVGESAPMRATRRQIERAASSSRPALIVAPRGSGRRAAARALHLASPRASRPFVATTAHDGVGGVTLRELVGTPAAPGLLEQAHGGTLYIDEIGSLPADAQATLHLVLTERTLVRPEGKLELDIVLVGASASDLEQEALVGTFERRLHALMEGQRVLLAPLASRRDDIPALVEHFLRRRAALGEPARTASPEVIATLARRPWPGHVSELFEELAHLCAASPANLVDASLVRPPGANSVGAPSTVAIKPLETLEREAILQALEVTGNDKRKAAELLGISRAKVYQRLKVWGLI
ncbi:MAG: sigma 54-interacting transcriptional regulator [Planctomycetota bacterium]|nr:sigma 54-interacting transcriptional regulator [Planctomycetota bacterium]